MLLVVFGLIFLVTALLAAAEMATFSARPERMRQVAEAGDPRGRLVLVYQRSPVSFLAAGQVIATAAALGTGAIMQAKVVPPIADWLSSRLPMTPAQSVPYASTVALVVFTVLALILTNVVPKQIGFDHADEIAVFFARPFRFLINATRPIAWIVTVASRLFEMAVNRRVKRKSRVTEADVLTLIAEGIRVGSLDERETQFVKEALSLSERRVEEFVTPLEAVEALDSTWDTDTLDRAVKASRHSYLPVYERTPDVPVGVLRARDWLASEPRPTLLGPLLDPPVTIGATESAVALFDLLKRVDTRLVFVRSQERTIGIVTVNDAVGLVAAGVRSIQD